MKRLQGFRDLVFDLVEETTGLVERTQASVWDKSIRRISYLGPLQAPAEAVHALAKLPTGAVYATIRGVNRGVRMIADAAANTAAESAREVERALCEDVPTPMRSDALGTVPWLLDHAETTLNGVWGDYLSRKQNGLDLGMTIRSEGRVVPIEPGAIARTFPRATRKIAIFIHGLSCTEWAWTFNCDAYYQDGCNHFGSMLQADLGYTPVFVRYNSGRHISENGRLLSGLIEQLIDAFPNEVDEIALIGHSMGGLVARSAARIAALDGSRWGQRLKHVFCLGSPHLGAPIEKALNVLTSVLGFFEHPGTQVPAALLNARSNGVKDLRFGYITDDEWLGCDPDACLQDNRMNVPLLAGVGYYFLAATVSSDPASRWAHLIGDILVRPPSASGFTPDPQRRIPFRSGRLFGGMNHFHLASHPDVYEVIRAFIEDAQRAPRMPGPCSGGLASTAQNLLSGLPERHCVPVDNAG